MATKTNLLNRNGRWYFNKAFPKALWPVTSKSPFRISLHTESFEEAQKRRPEADRQYWEAVAEAKRKLTAPASRPVETGRHFSDTDIPALLTAWYHTYLEGLKIHWPRSFTQEEFQLAEEQTMDRLAEVREEVATGQFWDTRVLCKKLIRDAGFGSDDVEARRELEHLIGRGRIEMFRLELARLRGDFGYKHSDPLVVSLENQIPSERKYRHTIGDLIDAYREAEEHKWAPSTQSSYKPIWRLLEDIIGRDKLLSDVDRTTGRKLFEIVQKLPKNLGKKKELQGLTIPEAIETGEQLGLETLAPKTINGTYMGFLSTVFKWGVKEQWIELNPVLEMNVRDNVSPADKRDPFSAAQLRQIFSRPPWLPKDDNTIPLHYWAPLIALFQGMRRGEVTQLATNDLEISEGILVIHVREDGGGKRIKTSAGRRTLPVHDELLRLGFADYVFVRQQSGDERLFKGEAPNSRGQWGSGLTRWFTGLLKANKIEGRRLSFHSFRHNFEDRLRSAELHGTDIGRELTGRSKGKDSSSSYGSGYSVNQLKVAMDKIDYSGLGFPL